MTREFERPRRHRTADPAAAPETPGQLPLPERRFRLLPFVSLSEGEGQAWMVTFTDLIALMLTFFVMLFAMMKVDDHQWQGLTASLARQLDGVQGPTRAIPRYERDSEATPLAPATDIDYLAALIGARLDARGDATAYRVERGVDSLIIRLPLRLAFAPGDSQPRAAAEASLAALAGTLRNLDNRVELAGYAGSDDPSAPHASSWELSLLRAVAVAAILRKAGYDAPIAVRGYGAAPAPAGATGSKATASKATGDGPTGDGPTGDGAAGDESAGGRVDLIIHADSGTAR
ncbi:chemotaxis protein MotB [Tistlia consotensis]|uniref:Chemotaxis protein MotB n=1 Tax=Tistlia consotensis USBA 355 TaxID=560819 RepID=A0A1Y6CQE6_9PROT|nr:flagellar motor protein MotB [Tistlia consotensis]SMF68049.1 chemotaxis protein MotB [Tistlia consotensis USBA 355]SNR99106.1 chemotaxis protein MotB [Tistlia consotensis]